MAEDEFSYLPDNASEVGLAWTGAPAVRRTAVSVGGGRELSAIIWGSAQADLVLLHGGGQNAHTWDTVALALGCPLVAIDLPGHGHSDAGANGSLDVRTNAHDIATAIAALAPQARAIVGMSLGGMTALALADAYPDLVRAVVLVDVTPGVNAEKSRAISAFINGPESFDNFDDLVARTIEHNPTRTVSSLRRGILHNALEREDGTWVWRYRRLSDVATHPDFTELWDTVSRLTVPMLLVRGMQPQSVVDDDDEAELLRRQPGARLAHIENAGHSVQGDTPVELATLIADFAGL